MTLWSPKHHPKTTTISRRIRNRADLSISVQPPAIPLLKQSRSRRTTSLPTPTYNPIKYQTPNTGPSSSSWGSKQVTSDFSPNEHPSTDLLLAQSLDLSSYALPNEPKRQSGPVLGPPILHDYQIIQADISRHPLSPIPPSRSGTISRGAPLSTGQEQVHIPLPELRDMRYVPVSRPKVALS
jgi:hypothetical protein